MDINLKTQQSENAKPTKVASSLVSFDLTLDACMEASRNDSSPISQSLVRLKSSSIVYHSQLAQAHLQEHGIRLSLQHSLPKKQQPTTHTSDIKAFAAEQLKVKVSTPADQFYGTVWQGLPPLPQRADGFDSGSVGMPENFEVGKKRQDTIDKYSEVVGDTAKSAKAILNDKKEDKYSNVESKQKSEQGLIDSLLASFPTHLRPAVVELSKAIACLSPSELDNLAETADWRSRKLIRMIAAAKLPF